MQKITPVKSTAIGTEKSQTPALLAPDEFWMGEALAQARLGLGRTAPNPPVGAVLVWRGRALARSWHRGAGQEHAEVLVLQDFPETITRECELFVSLEPCSSWGKTPPCCDLILAKKIKRVVFASLDPTPQNAMRAEKILTASSIVVESGVCQQQGDEVLKFFRTAILKNRPYIIAKIAQSLDGKITPAPEYDRQISNFQTQQITHQLRAQVDAVVIGAETLRADNPLLTVRLPQKTHFNHRQPARVVITSQTAENFLRTHQTKNLFSDEHSKQTKIIAGAGQKLTPAQICQQLLALGFHSILLEAGANLLTQFLSAKLIDELHIFIVPSFLGGEHKSTISAEDLTLTPQAVEYQQLGDDIYTRVKFCRGLSG